MATPSRHAVGRIWSNPGTAAAVATSRPEHVSLIRDSHARCQALGLSRIDQPEHSRLIRSDLGLARERNRRLHDHAAPVMELLYDQIAGTESMIVLTDSHGTILHAVGDDDFLERAAEVALAPGANWAEQSKGTNAVGTALFAEQPTLVHADEHFMHANGFLTCSAAPIFDPRGNVLGVLDVSGDHRSYHQHTMGLVRMSARMIENHWLCDDSAERLRIHFHARPEFIGTLLEGILVVAPDGRVAGANRSALDQLGLTIGALRLHSLDSLIGLSAGAIVGAFRTAMPMPRSFMLADGRRFHFRAWPGESAAHAFPVPSIRPLSAEGGAPALGAAAEPMRSEPRLAELDTGDTRVSAAIEKLRRLLDRGIAWIVVGETGSGKEWLARAAHQDSSRAAGPFVVRHPPDAAGEDPLALDGGTLYLDAIGDWPAAEQARLLHALEERGDDIASGRIAVVAGSRVAPNELVAAGRLREDLYYRLNGLQLRWPALRERSDLAEVARRLLRRVAGESAPELSAEVAELFAQHAWPGNLRELASVLQTAAVLAEDRAEIGLEHLPDGFADAVRRAQGRSPTLEEAEIDMIRRAVEAAQGNISVASRRLGISRNTIYRKLRWNTK
jgi:transcriptional regulator of acetoin/glycerol metabolism